MKRTVWEEYVKTNVGLQIYLQPWITWLHQLEIIELCINKGHLKLFSHWRVSICYILSIAKLKTVLSLIWRLFFPFYWVQFIFTMTSEKVKEMVLLPCLFSCFFRTHWHSVWQKAFPLLVIVRMRCFRLSELSVSAKGLLLNYCCSRISAVNVGLYLFPVINLWFFSDFSSLPKHVIYAAQMPLDYTGVPRVNLRVWPLYQVFLFQIQRIKVQVS